MTKKGKGLNLVEQERGIFSVAFLDWGKKVSLLNVAMPVSNSNGPVQPVVQSATESSKTLNNLYMWEEVDFTQRGCRFMEQLFI